VSTILKALKQSEARRRRAGPLPAQDDGPGTPLPRGRRRLQWFAALSLVALGAALGWYLAGSRGGAGTPPRETRIAQASLPERGPPDAGDAARGAQPDSAHTAESATVSADESAEAPATGEGPAAAAGKPFGESGEPAGSSPEPAENPKPGEPEAGGPAPEQPAAKGEAPQAQAEPALGKYALLPRWRDLPEARRQALSPLTLNAHVFAPEPSGRFVLINLSRYGEGDQVRPGLRVEAIFPGGVVLEDGQGQFVIPRP